MLLFLDLNPLSAIMTFKVYFLCFILFMSFLLRETKPEVLHLRFTIMRLCTSRATFSLRNIKKLKSEGKRY